MDMHLPKRWIKLQPATLTPECQFTFLQQLNRGHLHGARQSMAPFHGSLTAGHSVSTCIVAPWTL